MLKILREHATSWLLKGILILVAVTFVSWGGSYLLREKKLTYAAKVNGTVIDLREYVDAYQNMVKQYRDALGPAFSEKMVEELKLKEKLFDDFINRILIVKEATRLGLTVNDEELRGMIQAVPSFQVNGQFDPRVYDRFLRSNRMSAEEFEQHATGKDPDVPDHQSHSPECGQGFRAGGLGIPFSSKTNGSISTSSKSPLDAFKSQITTNDIETKDYYSKNQEEFRTPTFVQIQYLAFRLSDFEGKVQVSPEDIKRTYETQKDRFKIPKQVKAREILIKGQSARPS